MAIISEANAVLDLVGTATNFAFLLKDEWYKGSAELEAFPTKVLKLSLKHDEWTSLLRRRGLTEDEHLKRLADAAAQILKDEDQYVRRIQSKRLRDRFWKSRRKAFPGKLNNILDLMLEIVDAGPQLLAARVDANELLDKIAPRTPTLLPFGPDCKYVPLLDSAKEVMKALENPDASRVVTVHGMPGMGKTSLLKHLALYYEEERKQQIRASSATTPNFPDGVFYLFCGRGANSRLNGLQSELLGSLGSGDGSAPSPSADSNAAEEYLHLPSPGNKMRSCLAHQKVLIILDDVWEGEVLQQLLVPGKGLKYLISSQNAAVWDDAEQIELKHPNIKEARKIMANYTRGLPTRGEFPKSVQDVTDAIINELEYHPLALANIGLINKREASDPKEWEAIKGNLLYHLEDDFHNRPVVYESTYPQKVGASMMLMVDSLRPEARRLLFLVALLEGQELPEVLVKYFLKFTDSSQFEYKEYNSCLSYLEERSLVEFRGRGGNSRLAAHGLRTHYIRKKNTVDVRSIAAEILGAHESSYHDAQLIKSGDTEETLVTIMGAMFYSDPFRDVVATKLKMQIEIFNEGLIPRSMAGDIDALDLVKRTRDQKDEIESLVWLLNPDGESGWQQRAQGYGKKIIIRFVCRGELDDDSIAGLLRLPQTTSAASKALRSLYRWVKDYKKPFSSTHGETMSTLLSLLHDDTVATNRRSAAIGALGVVLEYESEDEILRVSRKWVEFLGNDASATLQTAVAGALSAVVKPPEEPRILRTGFIVGECPGFLEGLLTLLAEGKDAQVRESAESAIWESSSATALAVRIASIPGALGKLFHALLSESPSIYDEAGCDSAGWALANVSSVAKNRSRIKAVEGGLKGLVEVLVAGKLSNDFYEVRRLTSAATILGNLALEEELRETILGLSGGLVERLTILQTWLELNDGRANKPFCIFYGELGREVARALTILDPVHSKSPTLTTVPPPSPWVCYPVYMGRAHAYRDMSLYAEALVDVDLAHQQFHQIPDDYRIRYYRIVRYDPHHYGIVHYDRLRRLKVFLKAMLEDYEGAMVEANAEVEGCRNDCWTYLGDAYEERGVLQRLSGNLPQALADLDEAVQLVERSECSRPDWFSRKYRSLMQRGFVKHLMDDDAGARADAESAQQLKLEKLVWEETQDTPGPHCLSELPFSYLGFTL